MIEDGEAFKNAQEKCIELEKDITRLEKKIFHLNEIDLNIRKKEKEIASYKEVDNVELQNAKSIPLEIKSLRTSLSKQLFGVKVTLESDVDYSIVADGKKVKGKEAQMHAEATIEFPGIANVEFRNLTGEEEPLVDEIDRKENVLGKIFKKYGVKSVENLEDLYERRKASINEKENLRTKRETILDGEEFSKLKRDLNSFKNELKKENKIKDELKSYSLTEVQLKKNKGQKSKIVEKKEKIIVGVIAYEMEHKPIPFLKIDEAVAKQHMARLHDVKKTRNNAQVGAKILDLKKAASDKQNLMPYILSCVKSYATLGEIMDTLREVYGEYQEPITY